MTVANDTPGYLVWGVDNVVYGPVDLPALIRWVQDERVLAATWVYRQASDAWQKAADMPELQMFLRATGAAPRPAHTVPGRGGAEGLAVKPGSLRRLKIFAAMTDERLRQFLDFMEVQRVKQWEEIVREGSPGDAMFLILEGEVRVRLMIAGKETILATLAAGEFFGEIALFDHGPRSADVLANADCLLLRISSGAFQRLVSEAPDLASPFLYAVGRTLISRLRADNKRYRDSIAFARMARASPDV